MTRSSARKPAGRPALILLWTLLAACAWAPGAVVVVVDAAIPGEESCSPINENPDPGETLTYLVFLLNTGDEATTDLVATLQPTGGVTGPSGPWTYGVLLPGGSGNPGTFTLTVDPAVSCGSPVTLTFQLQDGATDLGTVSTTLQTGVGGTFYTADSGGVSAAIPDNDPNGVTVPVSVSGFGKVAWVAARVRIGHSFTGDLTLTLSGPDGTTVVLSNQRGGNGNDFGTGNTDCSGTFTEFSDASSTVIADGTAPFAGSYRPEEPLSAFEGKDLNGTWTLKAVDGFGGDTGTIYCVQLEIQRYSCCGVPEPPLVVAAGSALEAEGCVPANGAPDPGEDVTVGLGLQNLGGMATTNLVATLQPGNGVTDPGAAQNYGVLNPSEPAVTRSFSFTVDPSSLCGSTITLALQLQDGVTDLGTVHYPFTLGATVTSTYGPFSNTGAISIPVTSPKTEAFPGLEGLLLPSTGIPGIPFPSPITVSGYPTTLAKVTATLTGLTHQCPEQVYALLVGPGGQAVMLLSAAGGGTESSPVDLTFDDDAASFVPTPLASGAFKPTHLGPSYLPDPAPIGPYPASLSSFKGTDPNGTWGLFIYDDTGIVSGGLIAGGWSLELFFTSATCCYPPPCVILSCDGAAAPASGYAPLPVTFTGTAQTENCDDPPTYMWVFGDGEIGYGETVPHTYAAPGTYNWSLQVSAGPMYCNDSGTVEVLACTPASITTSPMPAAICAGWTTTLTVVAAGDPAPSYQWYRDGAPVGADSPTYTTSPADPSASYTVTVTNPCGSETSSPAPVTVIPKPTPVISGPVAVCAGGSVTLDAGAGYYAYLWSPGGETTPSVTVSPTLATTYTVTVTDAYLCQGTSAGHTVTLSPNTQITQQPQPAAVNPGESVTLTVAATGGGALSYQWYQGVASDTGTPVGANSPSFTTPALSETTAYWVRVTGACGSADSDTAVISVGAGPVITRLDFPATVCSGNPATLTMTVTGSEPLTYQWFDSPDGVSFTPIPGADQLSWVTPPLTATRVFRGTAANALGTDRRIVKVTVIEAPVIVSVTPATQQVNTGHSATLEVVCTGTGPLAVQWYEGESGDVSHPVEGANSAVFHTPQVYADTRYWVRVSNACGDADSETAAVIVWNVYYLPHASSTTDWTTRLSFVNAGGLNPKTGQATSEVEVRAYAADGELVEEVFLNVPPQTQYEADLADLLPPGTPMADLWLRVESRNELKGLMQFGTRDGGARTSLPLLEWPTRKAVFPHVSSILGWFTGITFVNTADVPAEVRLSAYAEDGALLAEQTLPLGPRSKHARVVTGIFPPELDVASIKSLGVESNQPLLGFELFGNPQRHGEGVAGLPLVRLDERKPENFFFGLFYPEAAESETWYKSVTFTNLDAGPGIVMADAYDAAGVKLGSEIITLNPREQMTREVRELFPPPAYEALDYFLLGSFSAIAGFELTLSRTAPFRFDGLLAIEQAYPRQVLPAVVPGATRLRLVNKSDSPMDLAVKAFNAGGLLLGTHPVTLAKNAKADLDVSAVIPTDGVIAWLLVEGNNLFTAHAFIATPDGECLVTYPGVPLY